MAADIYRYVFPKDLPFEALEDTLVLALMGTEALHGEPQVRLDAGHFWDKSRRTCVIDATTAVGRDLNKLFIGYLTQEHGADAFGVERVDAQQCEAPIHGHG